MAPVDAVTHVRFHDAGGQIKGGVVDHEGVFGDVVERRTVGLGRAVGHDVAATRVGDHIVLVKRGVPRGDDAEDHGARAILRHAPLTSVHYGAAAVARDEEQSSKEVGDGRDVQQVDGTGGHVDRHRYLTQ